MNPDVRAFAALLAPKPTHATLLRQATVTAVGTGTVDLTLGGAAVPGVKHLSAYTPTVGDVVFCLVAGRDVLVLGD